MHTLPILAPFLIVFNWLVCVILFERLYARGFFSRIFEGYTKPQYCKAWVMGETVIYIFCGSDAFIVALVMLWTVGVSHYFLCAEASPIVTAVDVRSPATETSLSNRPSITIVAVIRNIPAAWKKAAETIRPFIK